MTKKWKEISLKSFKVGSIRAINVSRKKERVRTMPGRYATSTTYSMVLKRGNEYLGTYRFVAKNLTQVKNIIKRDLKV